MDDREIIGMFNERNESAVEKLNEKYGKVCLSLSFNILSNKQDAEECVNDSYLGVWNSIPPYQPENLSAFLYKIVRNVSIARFHKNTAKKRNSYYDIAISELEETLQDEKTIEAEADSKFLTKTIEGFLETLSKENRVIFIRRYWFCDSYEVIAERVGMTEKNVSVRLTRLRKQLKNYLSTKEVI